MHPGNRRYQQRNHTVPTSQRRGSDINNVVRFKLEFRSEYHCRCVLRIQLINIGDFAILLVLRCTNNKNPRRISDSLIHTLSVTQRFRQGHTAAVHFQRALFTHFTHHEDFQIIVARNK